MSDETIPNLDKIVDHLFRHESGKMVAVLTRLFGFSNINQAEDIVQDTILQALESWKYGQIPANPQAWMYRVAKNKAIDLIRRQQVKHKIVSELAPMLKSEYTLVPAISEIFTDTEIKDSQLRMMFACCHPSISAEAQITIILKTLCGLSTHEIAGAFLTGEETIQKRLYRTREKLREENISLDYPAPEAIVIDTEAVLKALYLLFNEGYNSSHTDQLIREDLCEDAMRLTILLTENAKTNLPQTNALLALMCYHVARFNSRVDDKGLIILLKDQDRSQWSKELISKGNEYLHKAASGAVLHEFHIQAIIASLHANALLYEDTNWEMILDLYNQLFDLTNSPMVALNRCLVIGEVDGYAKAVSELERMKGLEGNCHYNTALGEMYFKNGDKGKAKARFSKALLLTDSGAEKELIGRKLEAC